MVDSLNAIVDATLDDPNAALDRLAKLVNNVNPEVRCQTIVALVRVAAIAGSIEDPKLLKVVMDRIYRLFADRIGDPDANVRFDTVEALSQVVTRGDQEVGKLVAVHLKDWKAGVRCSAVDAIARLFSGGLAKAAVLKEFLPSLEDVDTEVRNATARALPIIAATGSATAVPALQARLDLKKLKGKSNEEQMLCCEALWQVAAPGDPKTASVLQNLAANCDLPEVRSSAVRGLGRIGVAVADPKKDASQEEEEEKPMLKGNPFVEFLCVVVGRVSELPEVNLNEPFEEPVQKKKKRRKKKKIVGSDDEEADQEAVAQEEEDEEEETEEEAARRRRRRKRRRRKRRIEAGEDVSSSDPDDEGEDDDDDDEDDDDDSEDSEDGSSKKSEKAAKTEDSTGDAQPSGVLSIPPPPPPPEDPTGDAQAEELPEAQASDAAEMPPEEIAPEEVPPEEPPEEVRPPTPTITDLHPELLLEVLREDVPVVQDGDPGVRREALRSLVQIANKGDRRAMAAALLCLRDPAQDVREAAIEAIVALNPPGDVAAVIAISQPLMEDGYGKADIRRLAVQALLAIADAGNEGTAAVVTEQLQLAALPGGPVGEATAAERRGLLEALAYVAPQASHGDVQEALVRGTADNSAEVRKRALELLHGIVFPRGKQQVIDAAYACLKDRDAGVKGAASQLLKVLGGEPSGDVIVIRVQNRSLSGDDLSPDERWQKAMRIMEAMQAEEVSEEEESEPEEDESPELRHLRKSIKLEVKGSGNNLMLTALEKIAKKM
mmetsp:Transcript_25384/g.46031  ORF Transcript_25384/g.46031 Transcript_25384/m.46031 type:complete len:775 (+) Transcript_25384:39-2363(+)